MKHGPPDALFHQSMRREAIISECGLYRYRLERSWDDAKTWITWVMLNPSTADHRIDDATIRRVVAFSRKFGAGSTWVVNLLALRTPHPNKLYTASDPRGPENQRHLNETFGAVGEIVAAWGAHPAASDAGLRFVALAARNGRELKCLGKTASGAPRHPLYMPASAELQAYP